MAIFVFLKVVPHRVMLVVCGSHVVSFILCGGGEYLSCFLVLRNLSRASCACLSLSRWKVSAGGLSRDRSFWRVWIAFRW